MVARYRVVEVRSADGAPAPPEVAERFANRRWTKRELEERGVRITGASAWYLALGEDWSLTLEPAA
jgi:hypothetical protein